MEKAAFVKYGIRLLPPPPLLLVKFTNYYISRGYIYCSVIIQLLVPITHLFNHIHLLNTCLLKFIFYHFYHILNLDPFHERNCSIYFQVFFILSKLSISITIFVIENNIFSSLFAADKNSNSYTNQIFNIYSSIVAYQSLFYMMTTVNNDTINKIKDARDRQTRYFMIFVGVV